MWKKNQSGDVGSGVESFEESSCLVILLSSRDLKSSQEVQSTFRGYIACC
jgi:hypothetical protein